MLHGSNDYNIHVGTYCGVQSSHRICENRENLDPRNISAIWYSTNLSSELCFLFSDQVHQEEPVVETSQSSHVLLTLVTNIHVVLHGMMMCDVILISLRVVKACLPNTTDETLVLHDGEGKGKREYSCL